MKQALHIFVKDARRFWPEILISIAITAAFTAVWPMHWKTGGSFLGMDMGNYVHRKQMENLSNTLLVLMPLSWLVLMTRAVHGETLVGDKQFWVTRPYEWQWLLAAKMLFVAAFVYVPFVLSQWALLWMGGFAPFAYLPGLLFNLLMLTGILVLPMFAIAAVTKNFVRMIIMLLLVILAIGLIAYLVNLADSNSISVPGGDRYSIPVVLVVAGAAVVLQYAKRKVWFARLMLVTIAPALVLVQVLMAMQGTLEAAYPDAANQAATRTGGLPLHIALPAESDVKVSANGHDMVTVEIPVVVDGVIPHRGVMIDDVRITLDSGKGGRWSSEWQATYEFNYLGGAYDSKFELKMKRAEFERWKDMPVQLTVSFALTEVKEGRVTRVVADGKDAAIPDFGICETARPGGWGWSASCRVPFRQPKLTIVSTVASAQPCAGRGNGAVSGDRISQWVGSLDEDPADFGLMPVSETNVNLSINRGDDREKSMRLCPGSVVEFARYELVRRLRTDVSAQGVRLHEQPLEMMVLPE